MKKQTYPISNSRHIVAFDRLFTMWLISENLYESFASELRSQGFKFGIQAYVGVFFTFSNRKPSQILQAAFPWSESAQGAIFWREASSRWQAYLKSFIDFLK